MSAIDDLRDGFPEAAKDTKLNLDAVLRGESKLSKTERWLTALSVGYALGSEALATALESEARAAGVEDDVFDDARAVATLMAMNNVFYRFRHLVGKEGYKSKPPRLRMNRMGQPKTGKIAFELASLAVSAVAGCETCVQAHERTVVSGAEGGLTEDHVVDAIRIASVLTAAKAAHFLARR
ncbi:MAG: alkyl hydroperoxide reductase [Proteobacteria bacterium]|nr:MAG: alkyl hydroperoxide reductase [Pseudomonadota bacterium]